ncbi:hypothetical protein J6590_006931 [Homalodisca vitripennis]|nr:hypothetical protein J6590_006931 [Homalodisca vitripennis]
MENERNAIYELENLLEVKVEECRLFVDLVHPFLAALHDGIIDNKGLVEGEPEFKENYYGRRRVLSEYGWARAESCRKAPPK